KVKKIMVPLITITSSLLVAITPFMQQAKLGKSPSGARLEPLKQSPTYKDGKLQHSSHTPTLAEGDNLMRLHSTAYIKDQPRQYPKEAIPSVKTDLLNLPLDKDILVWFGHSSYFIQIDGKRILVDPVFSGNASPIPGTVRAFNGTDIYTVADLPEIDYLFISHDHYDHLDYESIIALKDKT